MRKIRLNLGSEVKISQLYQKRTCIITELVYENMIWRSSVANIVQAWPKKSQLQQFLIRHYFLNFPDKDICLLRNRQRNMYYTYTGLAKLAWGQGDTSSPPPYFSTYYMNMPTTYYCPTHIFSDLVKIWP